MAQTRDKSYRVGYGIGLSEDVAAYVDGLCSTFFASRSMVIEALIKAAREVRKPEELWEILGNEIKKTRDLRKRPGLSLEEKIKMLQARESLRRRAKHPEALGNSGLPKLSPSEEMENINARRNVMMLEMRNAATENRVFEKKSLRDIMERFNEGKITHLTDISEDDLETWERVMLGERA